MGDENEDSAKQKVAKTKRQTAMATSDKANSQRRRRRRRRSLFSLLFAGSNRPEAAAASSDEEKASQANTDEKTRMGSERTRGKIERRPRRDVVLVRPREAKCIEATVVSLVSERLTGEDEAAAHKTSKSEDSSSSSARRRARRAGGEQKNTLQSIVKRKIRGLKTSKSRDEDADSYILDLNDCLDREKLRVSSSSSTAASAASSSWSTSSSSSSASISSSPSLSCQGQTKGRLASERVELSPALHGASPLDDKWQTNQEYIPSVRQATTNTNLNQRSPVLESAKGGRTTQDQQRRQKSPLLRDFLESHQIKLSGGRALSGDSLDARRTASPPSSASSCDSVPRFGFQANQSSLPPVSYYDELSANSLAASKLNELSESDRRLYHWRKLAARSVAMWQVPDESSSDENDDSDLGDFIDCHSPARVCYCSDDTSCSSVELIWSRGLGATSTNAAAAPDPRRPQLKFDQHLTRPVQLLTTPSPQTVTPSPSSDPNRPPASLVSPRDRNLSVAPSSRSGSRSPTPQRLQVYSHLMTRNSSTNSNSLKSCSSQSICQKPSILELAKPSRARDRRIGSTEDDNNNNRQRASRRSKEQRREARMSMPAPVDRSPALVASDKRARDWSAVPVSRSASGSDWHPNPLFGRLAAPVNLSERVASRAATPSARGTLKPGRQAKSCDDSNGSDNLAGEGSRAPPVAGLQQPLRRHSSMDIQQKLLREQSDSEKSGGSSPKSSRFKSFLARIRRRQADQSTSKSSERVDCAANERLEGLDEFEADNANSAPFAGDRGRRHRWSLRVRSPFGQQAQQHQHQHQRAGLGHAETHAYLRHLVNLDKRIQSNVSSLRSQLSERLSDTGKRASVLADQLITSIKDTTKEQLLLATTGTPARDRYDTLPNSFASSDSTPVAAPPTNPADPLLVPRQLLATTTTTNHSDGLGTNDRRAKLFSLIYMHQQQQATGKQVITRQPTSASGVVRSAVPAKLMGLRAAQTKLETPEACGSKPARDVCQSSPILLDELLEPRALLMDRFRAMERRAKTCGDTSELKNNYQRLSRTIAPRDRDMARGAPAVSASEPKRRSSCTV